MIFQYSPVSFFGGGVIVTYTLPKFNSLPLNIGRAPKRKLVFQPPFFRGELLNFGCVNKRFLLKNPTKLKGTKGIRQIPRCAKVTAT